MGPYWVLLVCTGPYWSVLAGRTVAPYMNDSVTHVVTAQDWDPAFEEVGHPQAPPTPQAPPMTPPPGPEAPPCPCGPAPSCYRPLVAPLPLPIPYRPLPLPCKPRPPAPIGCSPPAGPGAPPLADLRATPLAAAVRRAAAPPASPALRCRARDLTVMSSHITSAPVLS